MISKEKKLPWLENCTEFHPVVLSLGGLLKLLFKTTIFCVSGEVEE